MTLTIYFCKFGITLAYYCLKLKYPLFLSQHSRFMDIGCEYRWILSCPLSLSTENIKFLGLIILLN